jgi:phosphoribosylformimino-5-aminoimidazole carboxamide ribotide isomerase
LIERIIASVEVPVQVAGGVRSPAEVERLVGYGASRVVMGTAAIEDQVMVWDLCRDFPNRIVVSLDVRPNEELAIRGWLVDSGRFMEEVLIELSSAGVVAFLVQEAGRDALKQQANLGILRRAIGLVTEPVIASGGARDLEDLNHLLALEAEGRRLGGVIVGREVTEGRFTMEQARAVVDG